ncbi:MAG: glycogen debranching N-terminal domain-containing protein [Acidimicrobiia bacterium]
MTDVDLAEGGWFGSPVEGRAGLVTLVEGSTFCVAGRSADITPGRTQGLFFLDTRLVSRLELVVDGQPIEPLSVLIEDPFSAVHIGRRRPPPGVSDVPVLVTRRRYVGRGMRDQVTIRNYGPEPEVCQVELLADADFANLFAVKGGRPHPARPREAEVAESGLMFHTRPDGSSRHVSISFDPLPDKMEPGSATWRVHLEPGGSWSLCTEVALWLDGSPIELSHPCGLPVEHAIPAARLAMWRQTAPRVTSDHTQLVMGVRKAAEDLGALRIFDPDHPDRAVVAAGAPWFMTLFGRDSLLTAWMALVVDPSLARGVLETLADLQGTGVDPVTEEQPGKILHEVRFGTALSLSLAGGNTYFGSIDATPLFVMLVGELRRWGLADTTVQHLLPHVDWALTWIDEFGDADGDGYVEYRRANPRGLLHQGWKDSWDAIRYADGRLAHPPLALCEVQGYVYAAYMARARFADEVEDAATATQYRTRASVLKKAFNRDFWLPELGWYAMALDGDHNPVDALASNMAHCLWTGIVDRDKAPTIARHLLSPEMFSGWGLRTLASSSPAYNPVSYHCGSVWPHDTALAAAGLMRYGLVEEAHRLILGLLDLAGAEEGRLPELVAGFSRHEFPLPVPYPTSCSPQAWSAASPLLLLRTLLRLDPAVPLGKLFVDPVLPAEIGRLHVEGVPLVGGRISIDVEDGTVEIGGVPEGIEVVRGVRPEEIW